MSKFIQLINFIQNYLLETMKDKVFSITDPYNDNDYKQVENTVSESIILNKNLITKEKPLITIASKLHYRCIIIYILSLLYYYYFFFILYLNICM